MSSIQGKPKPKDQKDRDAAITERALDLVVMAGAGSGKTTLLTERFVELVAPGDDSLPAIPIRRLAAVTFTRKAAGELRNRIQSHLLELYSQSLSPTRKERVEAALSGIDAAMIGTIHSFSDRLLRLKPIEARISPLYEVREDTSALVQETLSRWKEGGQAGDLKGQWSDPAKAPADAALQLASEWLVNLEAAGVPFQNVERAYHTLSGVAGLVAKWIDFRDRSAPAIVQSTANEAQLRALAKRVRDRIDASLTGTRDWETSVGHAYMTTLLGHFDRGLAASTLGGLIRALSPVFQKSDVKTKTDFVHDEDKKGWNIVQSLIGKPLKGEPDLKAALKSPLCELLLLQAAQVYPVILSLYEDVKRRHEVIDQSDLLIKLRDLLRQEPHREDLASRFDHLFIDEFQDTDPTQTEIFLALGKEKGKLTIIGDPKQSIYRFRRADISQFNHAAEVLKARGARVIQLTTNFRSDEGLIDAFNSTFPVWFGNHPEGKTGDFDPATGWVKYQPLDAYRKKKPGDPGAVKILRLAAGQREKVDEVCPAEAILAARHIRWLVDQGTPTGDIAVLTRTLSRIGILVRELRNVGLEVQVSGGKEYARSLLLKRYILALNAVANRSDGHGLLALHDFPFSSVTPFDAAIQDAKDPGTPEGELQAWLTELRKNRYSKPVLHTALDVIEKSLCMKILGLGANAEEDLAALYRFANLLDQQARSANLDFDGAALWARTWLDRPPQADAPARESDDAIQVMSIHQSKGLEFPVVYLFDSCDRGPKKRGSVYRVSSDGTQWSISVGNYDAEFGAAGRMSLDDYEARQLEMEHLRLQYVAATRARDQLIVPIPEPRNELVYDCIWGSLLARNSPLLAVIGPVNEYASHAVLAPHRSRPEYLPTVASSVRVGNGLGGVSYPEPVPIIAVSESARAKGELDATDSSAPVLVPAPEDEKRVARSGGAVFGTAVHRALSLVINGQTLERSLEVAVQEAGVTLNSDLLKTHVENALTCLEKDGYRDGSWRLLSEVPFSSVTTLGGKKVILRGVVDLILARGDEIAIIDFKSDEWSSSIATNYVAQLAHYKASLSAVQASAQVTTQVLLTTSAQRVRS